MKIFRVLPSIIITASLLLCVKVIGMVRDTESMLISSVEAETSDKSSNVSTEKPADLPDQGSKKPEEKKPSEGEPEKKTEEKKPEVKKDKENPNVSKEVESTTDHRFTSVEVELLQSLAKRRDELDRWENNIQIKEATLDATEKRIEDKIAQIEAMKKQVAILLAQYNTQEDAKIHSLVKIYENMKPSEAARIFDEVEMPILLLVIDSMAEKKAAPILAAMNPKKAKQLTVELANERKINTKITSGIESQLDAEQPPAADTSTTPTSPTTTAPAATAGETPASVPTPAPVPAATAGANTSAAEPAKPSTPEAPVAPATTAETPPAAAAPAETTPPKPAQ